jgi:glycerol-3-phosphate acyltransferase PlsX
LHKLSKTFDYKNNAGALVIGLQKTAVKTHGSADKKQFYSSIQMLYKVIKKNVIEQIKKEIVNDTSRNI